MKKYFFLFIFFTLFSPAFFVFAEEITKIKIDTVINEDASIDVVEMIYYDFGSVERHGIYRDIPVKYDTKLGDNRSINIDDVNVVGENGEKYTYKISKEGKNKRIKIGDADKYVSGKKVYVISYTIDGAINYFDTYDELYWNAVGSDWTVPINNAEIKISAPTIEKTECFFGVYGSTNECASTVDNNDNSVTFLQSGITPGKNVTTVIGMPVGTVYKKTTFENIIDFLLNNWIIFLPGFVFIFMWRTWFVHGKDPDGRGTIVPYYEVPEDLSPAEAGMIARDALKKEHISALLIDLAVKGYIHIRRVKKGVVFSSSDYVFIKTQKNIDELQNIDEKQLYEKLFFVSSQDEVKMSQLKNTFYQKLDEVMRVVRKQVVNKGYYVKSPNSVRKKFITIGVIIMGGSFFIGSIFGAATVTFALVSSGIIFSIFGFFMPQRTRKGSIVREHIFGLKLYMETAEKDRINFHNAPDKEPKKFEELLPYAMALGVEKEWAKQFEDMYDRQPEWYEGAESFHPTMFASDMRSFNNAVTSSMSSSPSSAGSGGSGFSGGGSGGGFGGGGGGSW